MPISSQPPAIRRDLRRMLADGAGYALMVGLGETYLPAFVLAVGLGEIASGLVATLPMLAGAGLQLVSPVGVRWVGSPKRWVVAAVSLQAASFIPFVVAAMRGEVPLVAPFLFATIYWAAGQSAGAAWTTWVGRIVPGEVRARFFSIRTRLLQAGMLIGMLGGGVLLHRAKGQGWELSAFALIFAMAAAARIFSALMLSTQSRAIAEVDHHRDVPLRELLGQVRHGGHGRLLLYFFSVQTAAQVAGPFFNPYLLKELAVPYSQYAALAGMLLAAKVALLVPFGHLAHRVGPWRLLWVGGLSIVPLALLWMVSDNFWYLMGVQGVAGAAWAAYELASLLLFFEAIHENERTSVVTTYNFANALAITLGSLIGAVLLRELGAHQTGYFTVFVVSTAMRLLTIPILLRVVRRPGLPEDTWRAVEQAALRRRNV